MDSVLLCRVASRSPCEATVCTADLCHQIENHFCLIDGTTYTFKVHSAAVLPGARCAVLQIGAFSQNGNASSTIAATMRVTAAVERLHSVPTFLDAIMRQWLFASIVTAPVVH